MIAKRKIIFAIWLKTIKATLIILLYHSNLCKAKDNNCLNCEDFNRQNLIKCPLNYEDCGECIPGNIPDELDQRICYALEIIISSPKTVGEVEGRSIELPCEFNSKVECVWERNGQHVNIDDSYRYKFKSEGVTESTPAEDCTLIIEDLNPIDAGQWQCGSRATSSTISVKSALISVILKEKTATTRSVSQESQVTEISSETNAMHLYLDEEMVDRHVTSMVRIMNGSALVCRTDVVVDELRWEIDGQSIVVISNANSVQITREVIEKYFLEGDRPFAKVYCVAVHTESKAINSYVFITNQRNLKTITMSNEGSGKKLSTASIITIAIVIPCALIVSLVIVLMYCCRKKKLWNRTGKAISGKEKRPMVDTNILVINNS